MSEKHLCPKCGEPLPRGSRGTLCPNCLLRLGLEDAPSTARKSELSTERASAPLPGLPSRIGPYRILEQLGEGGMGVVYLAEQREPIERRVALKVIKLGMDTRDVIARFEIERQLLALMSHANIAKIHDAGVTEDGRPYFVMEHVKGVPITEYCDAERLDMRQRLTLFTRVCDAVQHAHQKGVIHRDIKPSNILIALQDGQPAPKIIDFGVAKATEHRLTERTLFTRYGQLIGTPEYMSPEQADPSGLDVDTRTDVYALGVLLYELLVGRLPFDRKELRQAAYEEIRRKIREDDPPKPSTRAADSQAAASARRTDASSLVRQLRGDLDWIVMKALEKNRTRRYPSVSELGADIERHLRHEPVVAGPPDAMYRVRKFVRRHTVGVAFGVTVFVLLAGFGTTMALQARRIAAERDRANQEATTTRQVSDFFVGLFKVADPGEARGNGITAREVLDRGALSIETRLVDQPLVRARLQETIGRVYTNLGLYRTALPLAVSSMETRRRVGAARPAEIVSGTQWLGHLYKAVGRYDEAVETLEQALRTAELHLGKDDPLVACVLGELATVYEEQMILDRAEDLFLKARAITKDGAAPSECEMLTHNYANVLMEMGRFDEAGPLFEQAIETWKARYGEDHPNVALGLLNLGLNHARAGRYAEAKETLLSCLDVQERILGRDHILVAGTLRNLAMVYGALGLREESVATHRDSLERATNALGQDHVEIARGLNDLAIALWQNGERQEAESAMRRSAAMKERLLGSDNPDLARTLGNLGKMLQEKEDYDDAESVLLRARSIYERTSGRENVNTAYVYANLADLYTDMNRLDEAEPLYRKSYEVWEASLGPRHPQVIESLGAQGLFHLRRGDPENGIPLVERAIEAAATTFGGESSQSRDLRFSLACLYLASGDSAKSLELLRGLVEAGYPVDPHHPDLAPLRGDPQFEALVDRAR